MDKIDTQIKYSELLLAYGNLLSNTQKEILEDYFLYNLSLSEIAENRNISRSAAEDAISKGKKRMLELDSLIHKMELLDLCNQLKTSSNDKKDELINKMEGILKNGI